MVSLKTNNTYNLKTKKFAEPVFYSQNIGGKPFAHLANLLDHPVSASSASFRTVQNTKTVLRHQVH